VFFFFFLRSRVYIYIDSVKFYHTESNSKEEKRFSKL